METAASEPLTENGRLTEEDVESEENESKLVQCRRQVRRAGRRVGGRCTRYWRNACTLDTLKEKFPIITWLPKYRLNTLKCDFIAGLTVGLTVIPQGMAYAALAGLDLQYGLYSAFMGCFVYCLMGTSKDITLGPTALMSILTAEYAEGVHGENHGYVGDASTNVRLAILLCFTCGITQIAMSIFRLGFLIRYISHPVITGFVSAASVIIATTQLKKIFGIKSRRGFFTTIGTIIENISQTRVWDLVLGLSCMIVLFLLKWMKQKWATKANDEEESTVKRVLRSLLWFVGTARNVVVVVVGACIAYAITDPNLPPDDRPLILTKEIEGRLPPLQVPNFTFADGNGEIHDYPEALQSFGSGLLMVPLIGFLESVAIAKAFGRKYKYKVNPTQELLAIGIANLLSSFVSSYPITGSFGRSAINAQSNVMTPMGGVVTGVIVLLALKFLSFAFKFIPATTLAAVIIMAVVNLFDFAGIRHVWQINKIEILPLAVTFFCCFYDIAIGIIAGITLSIVMLLGKHSRPSASVMTTEPHIAKIYLKRGLDFPGAEYIEDKLIEQCEKEDCSTVILDCSNITDLDYSSAVAFNHAALALREKDIKLKLFGLQKRNQDVIRRTQVLTEQLITFCTTMELAFKPIQSARLSRPASRVEEERV